MKKGIKKLSLRRETLAELQAGDLGQAAGGNYPGTTVTMFCTEECPSVPCNPRPPAPSEPCQIFLSEVICGP